MKKTKYYLYLNFCQIIRHAYMCLLYGRYIFVHKQTVATIVFFKMWLFNTSVLHSNIKVENLKLQPT